MSKNYLDFYKPDQITVDMIWKGISKMLFPNDVTEIQYTEMRRAFYIGFTESMKLMMDLSDRLSEDEAARVLSRIEAEVAAFHEREIKKMIPGWKKDAHS